MVPKENNWAIWSAATTARGSSIMVLTIVKFVVTLKFSFLGFLAWEFKENWQLYKANQAKDDGRLPACGKPGAFTAATGGEPTR